MKTEDWHLFSLLYLFLQITLTLLKVQELNVLPKAADQWTNYSIARDT